MSHYRIERLIGVGGLGMVYEARWLLPRGASMPVACKVMRDDRLDVPHYRDFMRQEATIGMQLGHNHANLVTVFDYFEDHRDRPCLAMELVDGGSVSDLLDAYHRLPATIIRRIATKVLSALAYLHAAQVLHRDLSPCNILVSAGGEVKVSDLNLTKLMDQGQAHTHTFRGKPAYASPEARENATLDARSDLYSLGVILYQMLAGMRPWGDERDAGRILACSKDEAFAPLPESTPPDLAELTLGLLRSQPDARKPQSAHEALAFLRRGGAPVATRVDLGGLVTSVMQRRERVRTAKALAQHELLAILAPGDTLVARAIHVTEHREHARDEQLSDDGPQGEAALPDIRPPRGSASATTQDFVDSMAQGRSNRHTTTEGSVPSMPDSRPRARPRRDRRAARLVARLVALLVVCVVASAILGALLYDWFPPANEHARTQPTTAQEPAPVQETPAEPTPVPAPAPAHHERPARPDSRRPTPGRRSHSSSSSDRRKRGSHVVPDAKIIEIE